MSQATNEEIQDVLENEAELVDDIPEEEPQVNADVNEDSQGPVKKKREKKEAVPFVRDSGKSLLPFSRVQKIIKADKVAF